MEKRDALTPLLRRAFDRARTSCEATRAISTDYSEAADSILRKTLLDGAGGRAGAARNSSATVMGGYGSATGMGGEDPNMRGHRADSGMGGNNNNNMGGGQEYKESKELKNLGEEKEKGR